MGRQRGPKDFDLPFDYWVFGRPVSYRNDDGEKPAGYPLWRSKVAAAAQEMSDALSKGRGLIPKGDLVEVQIYWLSPDPIDRTQPDLDNTLKPLLDALVGVVIEDDRQVHRIRAEKGSINSFPEKFAAVEDEIMDDERFAREGDEVTIVRVLAFTEE